MKFSNKGIVYIVLATLLLFYDVYNFGKDCGYKDGFEAGSFSTKKSTKVMPKVIIITPPCKEGPEKTEMPKDSILWRI